MIPIVLVFGNRQLPFEYVDAIIPERIAAPGERAHIRYTINKVRKECRGRVERYFFDSSGRAFFLGETPTIYFRALQDAPAGNFERGWTVPLEASPGEGVYTAYPEFWCNGVQWLYPIAAPPQKARVLIVSPQR